MRFTIGRDGESYWWDNVTSVTGVYRTKDSLHYLWSFRDGSKCTVNAPNTEVVRFTGEIMYLYGDEDV